MCFLKTILTLALTIASVVLVTQPVSAQPHPALGIRAIRSAVQIALMVDVTEDETVSARYIPVASGTVISDTGLILTNAHAVDMEGYRTQLHRWEQAAATGGKHLAFHLDPERVLILRTDGSSPPAPQFQAAILEQDQGLDLALLQIQANADGAPIDRAAVALPAVALGDSDALQLGDPLAILSYPAAGGGSLTYTTGVVSGFNFAPDQRTHTWITTDATLTGGSSGGTAVNDAGALIGVPTQGSALDCRPGDTNNDGRITVDDVGCIPVGGSIGQLRPSHLVRDWLAQIGYLEQLAPVTEAASPAPVIAPWSAGFTSSAQTATLPTCAGTTAACTMPHQHTLAPADTCASSPVYPIGTTLLTHQVGLMHITNAMPGDWVLPAGSVVRITGPYVEAGTCDLWPVTVVEVHGTTTNVLVGLQGLVTETVF